MSETITRKAAAATPAAGVPEEAPPRPAGLLGRLHDPVIALIVVGFLFQLCSAAYLFLNFNPAISRLMPDDAYYYLNTARNVRLGYGSAFSPGEPTNGYHPLWMALLIVDQFLFTPSTRGFVLHALLLGVVGNLGAGVALRGMMRSMGATVGQQAFSVGVYLLTPWFVNVSLCGEGLQLYFLALFLFFWALSETLKHPVPDRKTLLWFGASAGLLMLARTDAIFFTGLAYLYLFWKHRSLKGVGEVLLSGAAAVVVLSPWLIWSQVNFGTIVQCSSDSLAAHVRWKLIQSHAPQSGKLSDALKTVGYWRFAFYNALYVLNRLYFAVFTHPMYYGQPNGMERAAVLGTTGAVWLPILWNLIRRKGAYPMSFLLWGVPALLLTGYYFAYRFYVQVWHLTSLMAAMLIGIAFLSRFAGFKPAKMWAVAAVGMVVTGYSLTSCYFYPQQHANLLEGSINFMADSPRRLKVGITDSGYKGYYSKHEIVNLDGVINNNASKYIEAGRFSDYIESRKFDLVFGAKANLPYFDRNSPHHAQVILDEE